MPELRIYLEKEAVVRGPLSRATWDLAPDDGIQVIVVMEPYPDGRRPWRGVDDRQLWTGDPDYDPFGWGRKTGTLIPDDVYERIWERACGDP